ncbi:multiple antibiotic resistance protein [Bosea sp. BK604]|nr:multiple antibiotic resistance protein [Bosea sp. BK604]
MRSEFSLFVGTFTTLLAIINPLEVLPVYLKLLAGKDDATHRTVAMKASVYALLLCFFFFIFGTFLLRLFGVPLSMVRVVGGIILMKIGFELFMPRKSDDDMGLSGADTDNANIAFVPLAMPLMFGPGGIATIIGMTATIRDSSNQILSFAAISTAIVATMFTTYICLTYAEKLTQRIGPLGIDAVTRIVGFFVSAIGGGLIFDGVVEALQMHGMTTLH